MEGVTYQRSFPERTSLYFIGTTHIVAASIFPLWLMELAFLAAPWSCSLGDPRARSFFHCPFIRLKFFVLTHIIGCQALAEFSSYTSRYRDDLVRRDSHHIQTVPSVLHESGNSNYPCPDYSPTVFLSRNSTCCIRLACLEHTFPLAHPNLQSSIFSEIPGNEKRAVTHPSKGANKRSM